MVWAPLRTKRNTYANAHVDAYAFLDADKDAHVPGGEGVFASPPELIVQAEPDADCHSLVRPL